MDSEKEALLDGFADCSGSRVGRKGSGGFDKEVSPEYERRFGRRMGEDISGVEAVLAGVCFALVSLSLSPSGISILPLDRAGPASGDERKGRRVVGVTECRRMAKGRVD